MRRLLLAALATGALALGAPAAHASHVDTIGDCEYSSIASAADSAQQVGEIDIEMIVYSRSAPATPVTATVSCYIKVNGVPQPDARVTATGTTVVVGAGVITYTAHADDIVEFCRSIDGEDSCYWHGDPPVLPPPFLWETVDPLVCEALKLATGTHGPVYVNEQGDVYIDGQPWWDCPPYDVIWP